MSARLPTTARGMLLRAPGQVDLAEFTLPEVGDDEGLVRVDACGVCGSDLALYRGEKGKTQFPLIAGHEIVGTVVALGKIAAERRRLNVGARIVLEESIPCHACERCLNGHHRTCVYGQRYGGTALQQGGELLGGYAEYVRLPAGAIAHPVPDDLSAERATLFIPVSNGLSWMRRAGRLRPGDVVVVIGPGQHGLASVAAARHLGAGTVVVAGQHNDQKRLDAARALGADATIDVSTQHLVPAIMDLTSGRGADVVVDATPLVTSPIVEAVQMAAVGGRIVLAGAKRGATVDGLPSDDLLYREITIAGVNARESWAIPAALDLLTSRPELFAPLAGPSYRLEALDEALQVLMSADGSSPPVHVSVCP